MSIIRNPIRAGYEEGEFTPSIIAQTPGDVAVAYTTQSGLYSKIGNRVMYDIVMVTSSFPHTTASGQIRIDITGAPTPNSNSSSPAATVLAGLTIPANVSHCNFRTAGTNQFLRLIGSATNGGASNNVAITAFTTGSSVEIRVSGSYLV